MNRLSRLVVIACLGLTAGRLNAEPTPTVQYLMREPLSMFDFGIYRLQRKLDRDTAGSKFIGRVMVDYEWDRNRIVISVSSPSGSGPNRLEETKNICTKAIQVIRQSFRLHAATAKPVLNLRPHSALVESFLHFGYKPNQEPEDLGKQLDIITLIEVTSLMRDDEGNTSALYCTSAISSKEIEMQTKSQARHIEWHDRGFLFEPERKTPDSKTSNSATSRWADVTPVRQRQRVPFDVSTGVSAADRVTTIRAATSPGAKVDDLVTPGHVFPLRAHIDGLFGRRGHTEGAIDLARLAKLRPGGRPL